MERLTRAERGVGGAAVPLLNQPRVVYEHRLAVLVLAVLCASPAIGQAQDTLQAVPCQRDVPVAISGFTYDRMRMEELEPGAVIQSQFVRRNSTFKLQLCPRTATDLELAILPAHLQTSWSQGYPIDRNNGALWGGRGIAAAVTAGIELRFGVLSAGVNPTATFQENQGFELKPVDLPGYTRLINAGHPQTIDWPQRFGFDSYATIDPGQSYVRVDTRPVSFGISHENIWIGPSLRTPLLLSNTASGFPHLFITANPIGTPIGKIGVDALWGRLDESDYFDGDESNDHRLLSAITVELEPRGAPGLFLGVSRLYTSSMNDRDVFELLGRPYGLSGDDQLRQLEDNALFAAFVRYVLPSVGAEAWLEWGHENGFAELWDLVSEPDQTQAYVIGFQKITPVGRRTLAIYAELVHLESPLPLRRGRGAVSFYTHGSIRQGHTHKGQVLGAWIGPGSDAQMIALDWIGARSSTGFYIERARFDTDAYLDQWAIYYGHNGHDAQLSLGARHDRQIGPLLLAVDASYANRHNRNFLRLDGTVPGELVSEGNFRIDLELIWRPAGNR
jgi:hypothetical protein